jgi:hypothetical protein
MVMRTTLDIDDELLPSLLARFIQHVGSKPVQPGRGGSEAPYKSLSLFPSPKGGGTEIEELKRLNRMNPFDEQAIPDLKSEAIDFRAAS